MSERTCQGCGEPLPPKTWQGRDQKWCSDKCRKFHSYVRHCVDCGKRLSCSDANGPKASTRCIPCNGEHQRVWTPETVVAAIQRWADERGGVPPRATEWLHRSEPYHPPVRAVQEVMGSWSAAIRAAGFDAFTSGHYGRDGEYPEVIAEAVELYRSGLSAAQVAERQGITPTTALYRLKKAGEPRRSPAEGIRLRMAA